jgi:hypothetical protein
MPLFPRPGASQSRIAYHNDGRQVVQVIHPPRPEDYTITGTNLACYRTYRSIVTNVRVIRDAFYLAGGNLHCVIGVMD